MNNILKFLFRINLKSIYFNFKYLPFNKAVYCPFLISRNVYLRTMKGSISLECDISPGLIQIGYKNVGIFDEKKSRGIWEVNGNVLFKGKARIGQGSKICVEKKGTLVIGDNFNITAETTIIVHKEVVFGDSCLLSWNILIMDTDFHQIKNQNNKVINKPKSILFGNKVWIGCNSIILKGSIFPNNTIIGANSQVNSELFEENSIFAGNPIRLIRSDVQWDI